MTVVCFDGKTLAGDKFSMGHSINMITKVFKINGMLVGFSGKSVLIEIVKEWAKRGFNKEDMPEEQKDPEKFIQIICINQDRQILVYENSHIPWINERGIHGIGSGCDIALGAMAAGKSAVEAVRITCKFSVACGLGIDSVSFDSDETITELL